jgi:ribonucleoside-diphosphate reductase alpha subunit
MFVIKRDGRIENVQFDKITKRINNLCYNLNKEYIDPILISQKVCLGVYKGVTTRELDILASETAVHLSLIHPDYSKLASRIAVSNLHKNTLSSFTLTCDKLYNYINPKTNKLQPKLADNVYAFIQKHGEYLNKTIVYDRDYDYDYFGYKTLEHSYLMKNDNEIIERPQHMIMRVACGIHFDNIDACIQSYDLMSQHYFTHATPTLFNAGTRHPQLSSCFLIQMTDDSIEGIFETLKTCALISKQAGGIGVSVSNIRSSGSYIAGTGGYSNGIIPMLRTYNTAARYVDQGGNKRKGSFAIYLEPWHPDLLTWLNLKKNHGIEEERARDLFYGLWIPDLFMERVKNDEMWSFFDPNEAPGLQEAYGLQFKILYESYEAINGKARKIMKAREIWSYILESQQETGTPYMLYKDTINEKNNQKNLGTLKSSNLCTEILEFTSPEEIAVCNLASISLPKCITTNYDGTIAFNFSELANITQVICKNLNKIIDINYYPVPQAEYSNKKNRPIGIGVQGLADTFIKLRMPFDSHEARQLNKDIFETIYYNALEISCELSKEFGSYESYEGSPISQGKFQFDLWNIKPNPNSLTVTWNWESLREDIKKYGVRNSLVCALMPTASTSQILGNNEAFEPYTSNIYVRRTLAGEFVCINNELLNDLMLLNLWNVNMKQKIITANGSIQNILEIPEFIRLLYRTVWEIPQKSIIDMAADRGPYIDQSQSMNIHMVDCTIAKLTSMHFYAWEKGLKTGMYYLRTKSASDAIKFTVDPTTQNIIENMKECSLKNQEDCLMCSS